MIYDVSMLNAFYASYKEKIEHVRTVLQRPLTLTEKILYVHLYNGGEINDYKRGEDYVNFRPDRVAMLKRDYTELDARTLDLLLVLQAEHGGGNNSTFTVRVTSSTGTDTYSSIAAGIGSLKGPLHDDLMDRADLRRGKKTVHKIWNDNTAILSGDAMLVLAYQYIAQCNPKYLKEVLDLFSLTALEICEGQQLDMDFEERDDVTQEEYLEMIRLKTSVLLAWSYRSIRL